LIHQRFVPMLTYRDESNGALHAHADDRALLEAREFPQRQGRRAEQVHRDAQARVAEAINASLLRLAGVDGVAVEPHVRHDDIDLARLPVDGDRPGVADQQGVGRQVRVLESQRRIRCESPARVSVARDEEVHAERDVRVGARLDVLPLGSGENQEEHGQACQPRCCNTAAPRTHASSSRLGHRPIPSPAGVGDPALAASLAQALRRGLRGLACCRTSPL
jgi:hypothetical protein